jgi:hypothetical protein
MRAPAGAKEIDTEAFRPSRALNNTNSYQGFASLTPGYYLIAPSGLASERAFCDRNQLVLNSCLNIFIVLYYPGE